MGDETRSLYERSLAICIKYEGLDAVNTSIELIGIGKFHHKNSGMQTTLEARKKELLLAKPYLEKAIRIDSMIQGHMITEAGDARILLKCIMSELDLLKNALHRIRTLF
jgi:hypothetical protein